MLVPFLISAVMFGGSAFALWELFQIPQAQFFHHDSVFLISFYLGVFVVWIVGSFFGIVFGFGGLIVTTSQVVDKRRKFRPRKNRYGRLVGNLIATSTAKSLCDASAVCGLLAFVGAVATVFVGLFLYTVVFHTMNFLQFIGYMAAVMLFTVAFSIAMAAIVQWRKKYPWVRSTVTLIIGLIIGGGAMYLAPSVIDALSGFSPSSISVSVDFNPAPLISIVIFAGVVALAVGASYLVKQFLKKMPFYAIMCPMQAKLRTKTA